jgi:hypothetical protein
VPSNDADDRAMPAYTLGGEAHAVALRRSVRFFAATDAEILGVER